MSLDPRRAALERVALKKRFPSEIYRYCCGHGAMLDLRKDDHS